MRVSSKGLAAIVQHEGIVPGPYRDSVGVWTFGIGHTKAAGPPDPESMPRGMPADVDAAVREVLLLFKRDIAQYERDVNRAVTVKLAQHEFDALVSFHFNTGGIFKAKLTEYLNAGDRVKAAAAFMGWKRPPEIIPRRKDEQHLFRTGQYPDKAATIWKVDGSGSVIWRSVAHWTPDQIITALKSASGSPLSRIPIDTPHDTGEGQEPAQTASQGLLSAIAALFGAILGGK